MKTEIMDEGEEKREPVTVDPTLGEEAGEVAESTGVPPIADSVLDRILPARLH